MIIFLHKKESHDDVSISQGQLGAIAHHLLRLPLPVQLPLQSVPDPSRSGTVLRRVEARSPMPAAGDEDLISTMLAQAQQDGSTNRREAGCAPPTPAFASHFSDPSAALALAALVLASASVVWRAARGQAQQQAGSAEVICAGGAEGEQICWTRVRPCPPHLRRTFPACLLHNAVPCSMAICASAASLHLRCIPLFNGMDRVADSPRLKDWFALMSVRTGLNHDGTIFPPLSTTSGTPLGLSIS